MQSLFKSAGDNNNFALLSSSSQSENYDDKEDVADSAAKNIVIVGNNSNPSCSRPLRRDFMVGTIGSIVSFACTSRSSHAKTITIDTDSNGGTLFNVVDPTTYPALVYQPPAVINKDKKFPVIIFLHGAGKNEDDVWNLANPVGEHAGLLPSLIASGRAPSDLLDNFIVIAPYSYQKRSFYEEPRSKLLQFITWATTTNGGDDAGIPMDRMDLNRMFLFGFSDGATLGIELMTTRRFAGGVFAAYGFTGTLPSLALERLQNLPMWIFHSADDVIFPVACSDRLVQSLRKGNNNANNSIIKYTRFDQDPEGFTGSVKGHSTGITASKMSEVYQWLLSL